MASSIAIHLEGYEDLTARLLALPNALRGRIVRPALRAGAKVVAIRIKGSVNSRRMRAAKWDVRAIDRSRTKIGYQVRSPNRAALGIMKSSEGYFPAQQELGWRPGKSIAHDPSLVVAPGRKMIVDRFGIRRSVKVKRGLNVREARLLANQHRRKIPGKWQIRAALMGNRGMVFSEIARVAAEKMAALKIDVGGASSLNDFAEGGA